MADDTMPKPPERDFMDLLHEEPWETALREVGPSRLGQGVALAEMVDETARGTMRPGEDPTLHPEWPRLTILLEALAAVCPTLPDGMISDLDDAPELTTREVGDVWVRVLAVRAELAQHRIHEQALRTPWVAHISGAHGAPPAARRAGGHAP